MLCHPCSPGTTPHAPTHHRTQPHVSLCHLVLCLVSSFHRAVSAQARSCDLVMPSLIIRYMTWSDAFNTVRAPLFLPAPLNPTNMQAREADIPTYMLHPYANECSARILQQHLIILCVRIPYAISLTHRRTLARGCGCGRVEHTGGWVGGWVGKAEKHTGPRGVYGWVGPRGRCYLLRPVDE